MTRRCRERGDLAVRRMALAVAAVMAIALVPVVTPAAPRSAGPAGGSDVRLDTKIRGKLTLSDQARRGARAALASAPRPNAPPAVGEQRAFLGIDDVHGQLLLKLFTLRGVGTHSEVWVASDQDNVSVGTDFPAGDCRNDGVRNVVTDAQVNYLIAQFDGKMYPLESDAFSVAPSLDGSHAPLLSVLRDAGLDVPDDYYEGPGDRVVVLVDNVRDENFFDTNNRKGFSYIAGFYTSLFDFLFNRQTMTIDAFDWLHRTGANPPNQPSSDPCLNATARPFLYEGVFAHEYQHLLENYVDADETTWVNEGLSDHAGAITGFFDPAAPITDIGFDSHVQCFLGFLNQVTPANPIPDKGGPENSLTLWGDQTDFESEVLCDYGSAFSFMEYLAGRFGADLMRDLHVGSANGLDSLAALLNGWGLSPLDVIENWATMVAVDEALGDGFSLVGGDPGDFSTPTLDASINWDNNQAFAGPGVPPNGSDYVRLRDATDGYLGVGDVESVKFDGASKLARLPVEWKVVKKAGRTVLYSGKGDNLDRAIVQKVKVGDGRLRVDTSWDTEEGYDYAYVQVSTNGGKTYQSVHCTDSIHAPLGPGFEGNSRGFVTEKCNLKKYAGKRVLLAFRYVTDPGVQLKGVWVDDVVLDGTPISDGRSLRGWKSPTQIHPVHVKGWFVRLVAIDETTHEVRIGEIPLDAGFDGSLSGAGLDAIIGTTGGTVSAIVTFLDRSETIYQTAPYTLTVNGVAQPGG
jgi:hypothetical protein